PAGDDPADGPAAAADSDHDHLDQHPLLLFALAAAAAGARGAAHLPGRDALCLSALRIELPADTGQAADGLPAADGGQPRGRKRAEALQPERVFYRAFRVSLAAD